MYTTMRSAPRNTVFIVDDDPDDRQVILDAFLENNNVEIDYVFVENGDQLMEMLHGASEESLPSLILLDLNMPGMLGLQALKEIKGNKTFGHIPTVILTTSMLDKDRNSSYALGANCFLRKPETYGELCELTQSIIKLWFNKNRA